MSDRVMSDDVTRAAHDDQPKIACVDTYYGSNYSCTGCVLLRDWADETAINELVHKIDAPAAQYVPGEFFRRELPCILTAIRPFQQQLRTIVVDGHVWLGENRKGLGAVLYEELERRIAVVGVAKSPFAGGKGTEVYRGTSTKPLIVTAAGMDQIEAAQAIQSMAGPHRIPALIKRADYLSRHG